MKSYVPIILITGIALLFVLGAPGYLEAAQAPAPGELRVVESNSRHLVLEFAAPEITQQERTYDGETFIELGAKEWLNLKLEGKPSVPSKGILVAIPQNARVNVSVLQDRTGKQTLTSPLVPGPTQLVAQTDPDKMPEFQGFAYNPDSTIYSSSTDYPSNLVTVGSTEEWRSQRFVRVQLNPIQYNPATRELTTHQRVKIELNFGTSANSPTAELGRRVNEGGFESIFQKAFVNYDAAQEWRTPARDTAPSSSGENSPTSGNAFRIAVKSDGIYQVTCNALQAAGLDLNSVNTDMFHLKFKDVEVAIDMSEDGDKVCESGESFAFFGQAPTDPAVPANIYQLTFGGTDPQRITLNSTAGGTTPTFYPKTLHLEQNLDYSTYAPWDGTADHYVWKPVNHPFDPDGNGDNTSVDITANLNDLSPVSASGTLSVSVQSGTNSNAYGQRHLTLYSNPTFPNPSPVYEHDWLMGQSLLAAAGVTNLVNGTNTFRVKDLAWLPGGFWVYLNYLELDYSARFIASDDVLYFKYSDTGTWNYQIDNFSNSNLVAYDITNPVKVVKFNVAASAGALGTVGSFSDAITAQHSYLILSTSRFKTPDSITRYTLSSLHTPNNGADYILLAPSEWISNVQPLAAQRAPLGRVKVVDVQQVYDEFSYGMVSDQAIRDFLEYAYYHWQSPQPAYVLLAGSGNYDSQWTAEKSMIPVHMGLVDPWVGMVGTDNYFVAFKQLTDLPFLSIGRLPARTAAELDGIIAKLLDYENNAPATAWRKKVLFITDNGYESNGVIDPAGNFWDFSEEVAGDAYYFPSPMVADRIYYNPCTNTGTYPWCDISSYAPSYSTVGSVRTGLLAGIASGHLIVNYVGHGAPTSWAHSMFELSDIASLTRSPGDSRYPFMLPMTCLDGAFQSGSFDSMAEAIVRLPQGGAVGSFAPSGLGVAVGHDYLDRGFFEALTQGGKPRAGQAAIAAKVKLFTEGGGGSGDLIDTYNLLGDPGMLFALPDGIMPTPTPTPTSTPGVVDTPTATPTFDVCSVKPAGTQLIAPAANFSTPKQSVKLQWNAGACVTKYKVVVRQGSKTGSVADSKVLKNGATSYRTIDLPRNSDYFWRVRACNAIGCSSSPWRVFKLK